MNQLLRVLKGEPVATMAIVSAVTGLAVIAGLDEKLCGAIGVLIGAILAFPVRSGVTPVASAVASTRAAAHDAAAQVASRLDDETAGAVGTITDHAAQLVDTAADSASDAALRGLGVTPKGRGA